MGDQSSSVHVNDIVEYIARGHAFDKHVLGCDSNPGMKGLNAFCAQNSNRYFHNESETWIESQNIGDNLFIETPDDLADYIMNDFLKSEYTIGYISPVDGGVNLLNKKDNVAVHFSWGNKDRDFGTVYRYPRTSDKFENALKDAKERSEVLGQRFQTFDNADDPDAAMKAVQALLDDINANPQNYLRNPRNPESTVQNRILENVARPGRNWDNDEIVNAPHNVKGHSQAYAEHHGLDVDPEAYVCIQSENDKALDIGRISKSLRSGRVLREINLGPSLEFEATIAPEAA